MTAPAGSCSSGVSKTFHGRGTTVEALRDVSLTCPPGSFTALIGPSGCGKSTILRAALGLEPPDAGTVAIGGEPPRDGDARAGVTGVAFQDAAPAALADRSCDNIALPLDVLGRAAAPARAASAI